MGSVFADADLVALQDCQDSHMSDTCKVQVWSAEADDYGGADPTYTAGGALSCGVKQKRPREVQAEGEVPVIDCEIRLPIDTTLDPRDRIELTHRHGEALAASEIYEIVGPVMRGPSGLVVNAKLRTED